MGSSQRDDAAGCKLPQRQLHAAQSCYEGNTTFDETCWSVRTSAGDQIIHPVNHSDPDRCFCELMFGLKCVSCRDEWLNLDVSVLSAVVMRPLAWTHLGLGGRLTGP